MGGRTVKRTVSKAGRLLLLYWLRREGVLDDLTLQAIGDALGLDRSTIHRDLNDLNAVEEEYRRLMAIQPWVRREFSTSEFAEKTGLSPDTVRALINDGAVEAVKVNEQWCIPRRELQRWRQILGEAGWGK